MSLLRKTALRIENSRIVVDTYAWIEYFRGTSMGLKVKEYLARADYVYTPTIVLAEIARKYIREGISIDVVEERLGIVKELSAIIGIDSRIALESGKAYIELVNLAKTKQLKKTPGLGDAIILATARVLEARILTGDEHFKYLRETIWLKG